MPWGLFILLAAGLALAWLCAVIYTIHLLTRPPRRTYAWAVARNLPGDPSELPTKLSFIEWTFRSRNRDLPVWDITGLNPSGPTLIITHGWADSRIVMLPRIAALAPACSRIIAWDLPGHGSAPGKTTLGTHEIDDLIALIDALRPEGARSLPVALATGKSEISDPAPWADESHNSSTQHTSKLSLLGFSLGAGISLAAAIQRPNLIARIIAEAPYRIPPIPARNVLRIRALPYRTTLPIALLYLGLRLNHGFEWFISSLTLNPAHTPRFDRAKIAAKLSADIPLLLLHGSDDPVCPIEDSRAIGRAAPISALVEVRGGGHNNLWTDPAFASYTSGAISVFLYPHPKGEECSSRQR